MKKTGGGQLGAVAVLSNNQGHVEFMLEKNGGVRVRSTSGDFVLIRPMRFISTSSETCERDVSGLERTSIPIGAHMEASIPSISMREISSITLPRIIWVILLMNMWIII